MREGLCGTSLCRTPVDGCAVLRGQRYALSKIAPGDFVEPEVSNLPHLSTILKKAPSGGLFNMAEREGFEPSIPFGIHTFQACSFDRSDISPNSITLAGSINPVYYLMLCAGGIAQRIHAPHPSGRLMPASGASASRCPNSLPANLSNPRYLSVYTLSRRAPSTARTSLLIR